MHSRTAAALLPILLLACSSSSSTPSTATDASTDAPPASGDAGTVTISTSGYDTSCATTSDCVLVMIGSWSATDPCCGHGCPGAAINVADQSKFNTALQQTLAQCMPPGASGCGLECAAATAYCNAGTCAVCSGTQCADAGGSAEDAAAD